MSEKREIEELRQKIERLEKHVDWGEGINLYNPRAGGPADEYFTADREPSAVVKAAVEFVDLATDGHGAAEELVIEVLHTVGIERGHTEEYLNRLRRYGEIYEPAENVVKVT